MNNWILWALPAALVAALVAWLALRGRGRPGDGPAARAPAPPVAVPARPAEASPPDPVAVQHQAATEALRQARRRKAEDEARQQAERVAAQGASPQAAPASAIPPSAPRPPLAAPVRPPLPAAPAQPAARAEPALRAAPAAVPPVPQRPAAPPMAAAGRAEPAAPPARAPLPPRPEPVALAAVQRPPARPAGPPTVLVADDSKVVRVKTGRLLEKQGWRVLLADDGQAALRCLDTEAPDLLITDVEMPGLDGFELTRAVRAHPRWSRLPVIMITSSDDKHRAEASAAGVNLLMGKPYAEEDLLRQAQTLLGRVVGAGAVLH